MTQLPPAGWYPEAGSPTGQRYWDGSQWTQHVEPPQATVDAGSADTGAAGWASAAMLTAKTVQIEQRGKIIEPTSFYELSDGSGAVGRASQVGQRRGGRLLKAMTDLDRNMAITIEFADPAGALVMTMKKPGGVGPQRFLVMDPSGGEIAQIHQRIRVVREAFEVIINGQPAGFLASQNWRDRRFSVVDPAGEPYAVVHKLYEGYARAVFTSADRYVVEYAETALPPQRALALASAIAMDIALYQT